MVANRESGNSISVIIPTRNRSGYLKECLRSLKDEIDETTKVYVIDDGSSACEKVLNSQMCNEFKYFYQYSEENRGMAVARNAGIRLSHSRWVAFLDDDVVVKRGWFKKLKQILSAVPENVVGVEGMVEGSGNGLWDREVQNLKGGLYITCHIIYRRDVLEKIGGFDETFQYLGPFCEDHEIAVRILKLGKIVFYPELQVIHLPRSVRFFQQLRNTKRRMRGLLRAEKYFYTLHPDQYRYFRRADTFSGTYRSFLIRHTANVMRRRNIKQLLKKPIQGILLLFCGLLEQMWAWVLIPEIISDKTKDKKFKKGQPDWIK